MTRYLELIVKKRDGEALTTEEIGALVTAMARGELPDHQIGALLMAIYLRGLDRRETADLTLAIVASGDTVDLSSIAGFKADKHSTGGVGDKVTLILGPLVAACGVKFPKLSGSGLAHTGGTLDKLESIPGMTVDLSMDRFMQQVEEIGLAVAGQTKELVPADGVMYALRDQTGTVDSVPLIASSVMSKKLAAGADGIILDVKCGKGAFMKSIQDAQDLARQMVDIGRAAGKETRALVTSMDTPLGFAVGNALEVKEAVDTLKGSGPTDLRHEVLALGAQILLMAGEADSASTAEARLQQTIENGQGLEKLRQMIKWQGGNPEVVDNLDLLPATGRVETVESGQAGYVQAIDAMSIGEIVMDLGAGRRAKGDPVSASAGLVLIAKPEQAFSRVERGSPLAKLHIPADWDERVSINELRERTLAAFTVGSTMRPDSKNILATIT